MNKELLEKRAYESFSTVTELADEMVRACGVPFRKAHGFVSHMVKKAERQNFNLKNITEDFFTEAYEEYFDSSFDMAFAPFHNCLDPLRFIYVRDIPGGTGPTAMENLLRSALQKVQTNETWLEQKKTGINIVEKSDIDKVNSAVKKKRGEKSPYNAVRYTEQEIDDKAVNDAIEVAEKAVNNLDKKVEESKKETIKIGNQNFYIDFNHI